MYFVKYYNFYFNNFISSGFPVFFGINGFWCVGFVLLVLVSFQLLTGIGLSLYLEFDVDSCLFSKLFIIKEVSYGWFWSYSHNVYSHIVFFLIYLHIFKSLVFPVLRWFLLWMSGSILFVMFIMVCFTGYSLNFGAMSYFALVVISNLMSFVFGSSIASCIFFDLEIVLYNFLVNKVYMIHFLLGMLCFCLMFLHMFFLHDSGSFSGFINSFLDYYSFSLIMIMKDIFLILLVFFLSLEELGGCPEIFFHNENFYMLSVDMTPESVSPEWYVLMFYLVLKMVDLKWLGMCFMFLFLFVFFFMPIFQEVFVFNWCNGLYVFVSFLFMGMMVVYKLCDSLNYMFLSFCFGLLIFLFMVLNLI